MADKYLVYEYLVYEYLVYKYCCWILNTGML